MLRGLCFVLVLLFALFAPLAICVAEGWRVAQPGWRYEFPRDHWPHPDFKTEWWYFTGQLTSTSGRRFGYQVTFFRQGVLPPAARGGESSRFIVNELAFAHAAVSDVARGTFRFAQHHSRGAFGEAGFGTPDNGKKLAWIDPWWLTLNEQGDYAVHAVIDGIELTLSYKAVKPWIAHGNNGISQKAAGEGRASHYYSGTRLKTEGTLRINGETFEVSGESWCDREWATNQLAPEQLGWNWLSLQFNDGTELMLYQMRLRDGGLDPHSSGTFVEKSGKAVHLSREEYQLEPVRFWESPKTKARYPVAWKLTVPRLSIQAEISTPLEAQELVLSPIAYWEGIIEISGTRSGSPLSGHGYMELTGYAGGLVGLSAKDSPRSSAPPIQ